MLKWYRTLHFVPSVQTAYLSDGWQGVVQLFVEEAKELKEADTFGSSDSYCKITGLYSSPSVVFLSLVSRLLVEGDIDL